MPGQYVFITYPGHPLAGRKGRVALHRVVLFSKIGPGKHKCHWCGKEVSWARGLQVDHLDWDKSNNDPNNLVPSCGHCNIDRMRDETRNRLRRYRRAGRLTPEDVRFIRSSGEGAAALARRFGVSVRTIYHVLDRSTWKHVD